jgi:hypothetical protein
LPLRNDIMAASGFGERLRREIARNKAKSAALGVLFLVACYFWMPIVTKSFTKKKSPTPVVPSAETTNVVDAAPTAPAGDVPKFDWKEFLTWMTSEPRMTVMTVSTETRDPFSKRIVREAPLAEDQNLVATTGDDDKYRIDEEPVKTPKECGLQLHSTFVGRRSMNPLTSISPAATIATGREPRTLITAPS